VFVVPPDNLPSTKQEVDYFTDLNRRAWDVKLDGPLDALDAVVDRFRAGAELFHFACHGNFDTTDANESKLKLVGDFLRPSQIVGDRTRGLRRAKPVVFLNACHGGRIDVTLTNIGGWAERFIAEGASAFIGALWEVNDVLAAQFARAFYDRLLGVGEFEGRPLPLGGAFHEARLVIKGADPGNPTWLAYVLYGDPYGEILLGA
jgi:CHAT domain-containing protein